MMAPKMARDEIEELHAVDPVPTPPPAAASPPPPPAANPVPTPSPAPEMVVVNTMPPQQSQPNFQAQQTAPANTGFVPAAIEQEAGEEEPKKESEHWVKAYWRPAMGWLYMAICLCDFIIFPAIAMFLPVLFKGLGVQMQYTAWQSLTLSNGGLIHMAFGAILGVAAYGRTQEKVAARN